MKTLETMVEGTKVGSYLTVIYAVIIIIASGLTLFVKSTEATNQEELNTQKVAQYYKLSESSAHGVICHQGMLHYRNIGLSSGVLPFNPSIVCSENELEVLQDNPSLSIASIAFIFLLLGLLVFLISYKELKNGQTK